MAYIDSTYYTSTYYGTSAGSSFDKYASRASDDIDMACMHSIVLADLDALQLALIKKATCAQVEWYVAQGDLYNEQGSASSESIGGYSRSGGGNASKSPIALSPRAMAYLEQSGLTNRACAIIGTYQHYGECD
jgi:hypothetical protein